jgi:hypothetical protein
LTNIADAEMHAAPLTTQRLRTRSDERRAGEVTGVTTTPSTLPADTAKLYFVFFPGNR